MNQSLNTATGAGQQPTHLSQGNKGSAKKGKGAKDTNARNLKTADVDPNKFLVYSVVDAIPLSNDRDLRDAVEEQVNIPLDNNDQCAGSVTSRIQLNNKGTLDVRLISPDDLGTDFIKKCANTHAISSKLASIAGEKAHVIDSILPKFKGALLASSSATAGGRAEAWTRSVLAELSKIMNEDYFELACIELEAHVGESAKSILKGLYEINSHEDEVHVGKHNLNQKVGQAILEAKQKGMSSIVLKIKLPLVAFVLMLGPRVAKDQFKEYCPGGESFQKVEDVSMIEENVPQRRLAFSLEDVEAINRTLDADDECPNAEGPVDGDPPGCPAEETIQVEDDKVTVESVEGKETLGDVVFFAYGRIHLKRSARPILNQIVKLLERDDTIALLKVVGHTDSSGAEDANLKLSQWRADAVKKYLVKRGVPAERVEALGLGSSRPVASNDTKDGRIKNRRVEFILIRKGQTEQPSTEKEPASLNSIVDDVLAPTSD